MSRFSIPGGERYDVEVRVVREATHFYGSEAEAEIRERAVEYVVNGVNGVGIAEWSYRNSSHDPTQFKACSVPTNTKI